MREAPRGLAVPLQGGILVFTYPSGCAEYGSFGQVWHTDASG